MKDIGLLMEPKDFKQWRSRFDVLKQIVRKPNPNDLTYMKAKFSMKPRASSLMHHRGGPRADSADSHAVETEEMDEHERMETEPTNMEPGKSEPDLREETVGASDGAGGKETEGAQTGTLDEGSESSGSDNKEFIEEESCIGFIYKVEQDKNTNSQLKRKLGSRLNHRLHSNGSNEDSQRSDKKLNR